MMATMALSTLFVTTAFAQENDVEVIEEAKILEEIVSYLEDGVTIDVAPNESKRIEIPLSNGESAYLEIGCTPANKKRYHWEARNNAKLGIHFASLHPVSIK